MFIRPCYRRNLLSAHLDCDILQFPLKLAGADAAERMAALQGRTACQSAMSATNLRIGRAARQCCGRNSVHREIEGENPLYLPQAKVYDGCCALGPCILLSDGPLPGSTEILIEIRRAGSLAFCGTTRLEQMKRAPQELTDYLLRQNSFPAGCFLLTGNGIVPPADFTLQPSDVIRIAIEPIGVLENTVA